jgi:hypothetical protein
LEGGSHTDSSERHLSEGCGNGAFLFAGTS